MPRAAVQLGMDANPSIDLRTDDHTPAMEERRDTPVSLADVRKDYFIRRNGVQYAGTHLIIDLWGARRLDDLAHIEETLRECVRAAGATLLHIHLHHFTPNNGVSGVAVLAESHISVHSWPESGFAAFDVFMCGNADPHQAIEVLKRAFEPERVHVGEHLRGRME
jgi:S-adenosylmethionine decarboxylase